MDELQISGKRYLSSRRVAKENGYHTDYIGQLIRGGKVKGQKVGRTWYVEADSFAAYLGKEAGAPVVEQVATTVETPAHAVAAAVPVEETKNAIDEETLSRTVVEEESTPIAITHSDIAQSEAPAAIPPASTPIEINTPATAHAVRLTAPAAPVIVRKVVPQVPVGLRYVADNDPLLPEIARNDKETRVAVHTVEANEPKVVHKAEVDRELRAPQRSGGMMLTLGMIAVAIFAVSAVVSSGLFQTINIQAGNPASVSYTMHW